MNLEEAGRTLRKMYDAAPHGEKVAHIHLFGRPEGRQRHDNRREDRKASPSHSVQVMLYMYAVPMALGQYNGVIFNGQVAYSDHVVDIPAAAVDEQFIGNLSRLIHRLGSGGPARKVPSRMECGYCDITAADCPRKGGGRRGRGRGD